MPHISGHSTGGGEAIRYAAKYGSMVAKVILISAVTPYMVLNDNNPPHFREF